MPVAWLCLVMAFAARGIDGSLAVVRSYSFSASVLAFVYGSMAVGAITIAWGIYLLWLVHQRSPAFARQFTLWQGAVIATLLVKEIYVLAAPDFGFSLASLAWSACEIVIGAAMIVVFVLLRAAAIYGDPAPWLDGPRAALGFLRTTKYPPSLQFVLMTIGPGLIALALIDRVQGVARKVLLAYGRVPLFFYLVHLPLLNLAVELFLALGLGVSTRLEATAGVGFRLRVVYLVWIVAVALLHPLCRWYGSVKVRSRSA